MDFVIAAANLRAAAFGLKGHTDRPTFAQELATVTVPPFQPSTSKKIAANDEEAKKMEETVAMEDDHDVKIQSVLRKLPSPRSLAGFRLHPAEFEKDDDTNFHMAFITACSNLRARNYVIVEEDLHATKFIAGKIIPAIATTTALVTGLVCLEMYKVAQKKKFEEYRNSFVNLAICNFNFAEPQPPHYTTTKLKTGEWKWSLWDQLTIDIGDCSMQELLDYFQEKFGYEISMLSYGAAILFYQFSPNKKQMKERLKKSVSSVCAEVSKTELPAKDKFLLLEACVEDEEGNEIDFPQLRFKFRN
jgi:ubiquitin-activating enzyme E1